jgi:putative transposase
VPQHIVQRGNNRQPCFLSDDDRQAYLQALAQGLLRFGCALHAYVLMDNHSHLLLTPSAPGAVSKLMQSLGRRYARAFNQRHARTGTLWEGRYWSCLVDSERYVLACYRYIELNPVRAGLVRAPQDHAWSSYRANGLGAYDPLITPHAAYLALADHGGARRAVYGGLVEESLPGALLDEIRSVLKQRGALGSVAFRDQVGAALQRFVGTRGAHRPRKVTVT